MDFELSPAQKELQARARALAETHMAPRAAEIDRSEAYPWDHVERLRAVGMLGMTIPKELGGAGLGYLEAALVIEEMAKHCGASARIVVETNMGAIGAILKYGSPAQRKLAADLVLSGDKPAICITEPGAGSAATEMTTRADKRGDIYVLNGRKHWITGGGVSRLHLVFARVFDERGAEQGIGGFILVRHPQLNTPRGLIIGKREPALGLRGIPETELIFENLEVPADMLLMPQRGLRHGFGELMDAYNGQRIGAATVALGLAQGAYEKAVSYANRREQFGRPIGGFQLTQEKLANMALELGKGQLLALHLGRMKDDGRLRAEQVSFGKLNNVREALRIAREARTILGANGITLEYPVIRHANNLESVLTYEGTSEIHTLVLGKALTGLDAFS